MKTFDIDGVRYAAPFADLLPPLTPDQLDGLEQSLRVHKMRSPVLTARTPTWGDTLLDGANRLELADRLEIAVLHAHLGDLSDEQARQVALDVNAERRHLTPEQLAEARARRVERVVAKRAEGQSFRTIAGEVGVSEAQVRNDAAGAQGCAPETVVGRDGKTYPARIKPVVPPGAWRDDPLASLALGEPEADAVAAAGVRTLGELCDRLDNGETFGLAARDAWGLLTQVNWRRLDRTVCRACRGSGFVQSHPPG